MDACLMTMLEVAYQLRAHARVLVGSEELEPNDGWPWAAILADLVARPAMTAREVGASVVRRYLESYEGTDHNVTQSAIDLGQLDEVVGAVDELARALLARRSSSFLEGALHRAWRRSLRFFEGAYVDLHNLADNLRAASTDQAVRGPCLAIQRALTAAGGPIIAAGHVGARLRAARGLSIPGAGVRAGHPVGRLPGGVSRERTGGSGHVTRLATLPGARDSAARVAGSARFED
jgi:hypothetical protein